MPVIETTDVRLEYDVYGSGDPVTLFAHGVSSSADDTRIFASDVAGTQVFIHFRGHGRSSAPETGYTYADVTRDLRAVADEVGATRALGVSMGAGAMLGILADTPDRFERNVFVIPASLDQKREMASLTRLPARAALLETGDLEAATQALIADLPVEYQEMPAIVEIMRARATSQLANPGIPLALRGIVAGPPALADRAALLNVTAPCLILGQEQDEVHPASVAREMAEVLPNARLKVWEKAWGMLLAYDERRELIAGFLNAP